MQLIGNRISSFTPNKQSPLAAWILDGSDDKLRVKLDCRLQGMLEPFGQVGRKLGPQEPTRASTRGTDANSAHGSSPIKDYPTI